MQIAQGVEGSMYCHTACTCSIVLTIESGARSLMLPTNTVVIGGFSSFLSWKDNQHQLQQRYRCR